MKKIVVQYGEVRKISKILRCTPEMVSRSLSFYKNTPLARKIRKVAMERGGVEVELPNVTKQQNV